jgi:protein-S-isoprenylcysteine O-methyltransferase Ste14
MQSGCRAPLSPDGVTRTDCSAAGVTHVSIAQAQGLTSLIPVIAIVGAILLGIAVFAFRHSTGRGSLAPLWVSTPLLCAAMALAILSIGIFFAPSALLAMVAAITGSHPDRSRSLRTTPA